MGRSVAYRGSRRKASALVCDGPAQWDTWEKLCGPSKDTWEELCRATQRHCRDTDDSRVSDCWQRDAVNVCADLREELCGRGKDSRHQQSVERDAHALHRRQRQVHRLDRRECLPSVHMRMGLLARVRMRACAARRRARTQVVVCGCVQRSEQTEAMLPVPARPSRRLSSAISPVGVNCK